MFFRGRRREGGSRKEREGRKGGFLRRDFGEGVQARKGAKDAKISEERSRFNRMVGKGRDAGKIQRRELPSRGALRSKACGPAPPYQGGQLFFLKEALAKISEEGSRFNRPVKNGGGWGRMGNSHGLNGRERMGTDFFGRKGLGLTGRLRMEGKKCEERRREGLPSRAERGPAPPYQGGQLWGRVGSDRLTAMSKLR